MAWRGSIPKLARCLSVSRILEQEHLLCIDYSVSIALRALHPYSTSPPLQRADETLDANKRSKRFNFVAEAAEIAAPAVVFVEVRSRDFWSGQSLRASSGSGFIVSANGTIVTNAHVVAHVQQVRVKLTNGKSYEGVVQEVDQLADLAVVKINPDANLPVAKLGVSNTLRAGEWVVAIGSPLSLSNSVTAGVVSTVGRASEELGLQHKDMDYVQTDAAITSGNSGGPLVNLDGEVIGINTMTTVPGISFAIPIDKAKDFLADIVNRRTRSGPREQRYVGISMLSLHPGLVESLQNQIENFPDIQSGVFVAKIAPNSPAQRYGLNVGDVIVDINGNPVKRSSDVYRSVQESSELRMRIHRGNKELMINVRPITLNIGN
ncbi:serine protease HTRA1A-like [Corticium candelabrum]|uniref:serine protease HTRA1A-like n=1 Tax=Corticium candelabrum TaxID=121492 RepID=UPI002E26689F|nr:serine protease HTRA1A-like [Corticium candelabrum]